jgi:hypothetical protein
MRKLLLIALLLISCGDHYPYTRAALDNELVIQGDSISNICGAYMPYLNRAIPGHTSMDLRAITFHHRKEDGDAIYKILIGVNDFLTETDNKYLHNMNKTFELLKDKRVIVTSILPTRWPHINVKIKSMNESLERLVNIHGFEYVGRYDEFTADSLLNPAYASDMVHLNKDGCDVLFNTPNQ